MAALLIGRVSAIPMSAETSIPIKKGCISVVVFTRISEGGHKGGNAGAYELGNQDAGNNGNAGSNENIHPCFLRNNFSQLSGNDCGKQSAYRSSQGISCNAYRGTGEKKAQLGAHEGR